MTKPITEILIIGWHVRILKKFSEKNKGNRIKDSGEAYHIN